MYCLICRSLASVGRGGEGEYPHSSPLRVAVVGSAAQRWGQQHCRTASVVPTLAVLPCEVGVVFPLSHLWVENTAVFARENGGLKIKRAVCPRMFVPDKQFVRLHTRSWCFGLWCVVLVTWDYYSVWNDVLALCLGIMKSEYPGICFNKVEICF